ncbi:imidazole glycerol phosphate synthase subunit HisH [Roseobacter sp. HKCCD7870]|uniref:imidazole glycerol phosphate synthase subunit HisH n=1 Tax=Roseobacter sp. HKCCD7870 TaxID=3120343 RepID=UPI0030EC043A
MIVIVDYGRGNLFSLSQALRHLGIAHVVSDRPEDVLQADRVIFPGVGAFGDAMNELRHRDLVEPLREVVAAGKPTLGICVGCQLMLARGEEFGDHEGLGFFSGNVSRLPGPRSEDVSPTRIPNVGWHPLMVNSATRFFDSKAAGEWMYFVHSYAPFPKDPSHVAATIAVNGIEVPVAIERDNLVGVQFHPEKSGPAGLRFLSRFLEAGM